MIVVGLMSGTSADGVDAAVVDIRGTGHHLRTNLLGHSARGYTPALRKRLLNLAERGSVEEICHCNVVLGEIFAKAAVLAMKKAKVSHERVALIGSHGQTVHHRPIPEFEAGIGRIRSTLQLGDPNVIAERTGISTVADFRARDLAVGGEGAPLTPYAHALLFGQANATSLVINLGGITNVTVLPKGRELQRVRAFDTGPCNMLLDGLVTIGSQGMLGCDQGGRLASKGHIHAGLLQKLLSHPYLQRRPPKSTGREMFGLSYVQQVWKQGRRYRLSLPDLLATSTRFIAEGLARSQRWLPDKPQEIIVGGGGVRNGRLWRELCKVYHPVEVKKMEAYGIPSQAFEAQAFAILAYQTIRGVSANLPSVTGARYPVVLGTLTPGKSGFPKCG